MLATTVAVGAYYTPQLAMKMVREIEGILNRPPGPQGVQYSLRATQSGMYTCYTCKRGTMHLNTGDVWKYGESTNLPKRYSNRFLESHRVRVFEEYRGPQNLTKVFEK